MTYRPLLIAAFFAWLTTPSPIRAAGELSDAYRPITQITPTSFTLQWYTTEPTETRILLRQGDLSMVAWRPADQRSDVWANAKQIDGPQGQRTYHRLTVTGLEPSHRYFYRIYDPASEPTSYEKRFGASPPWEREFAVATEAAPGQRTLIRLPVKVLLMPNVLNLESAHLSDGAMVPPPSKLTEEQLNLIRHEYAVSSRFFFINSGMRLWVDFEFFVDDRWQRWGPQLQNAPADYQDWPVCRSYDNVDYQSPGGGTFTVVDTQHPDRPGTQPVYEKHPYAGQVEQAFVRRYNPQTKQWDFYRSGGGTYGADRFNEGLPGRSQFLGGVDTAWLATHEFHHQLEGLGRVSFPEAENDRIIFDHPETRRRDKTTEGKEYVHAWTTAGRHGGHWDVISYWDRTLTPTQWLRLYLGEAVTVVDADNDGLPDDDPRLPFDEKRFGSDPSKPATDGVLNDRDKAMLATWAPACLQPSWIKPQDLVRTPDPHRTDSDGDGVDDSLDPYPVDPYVPLVWPQTTVVDGNNADEWQNVPLAGRLQRPAAEGQEALQLDFKQTYDEKAYHGLLVVSGPWSELMISLDGEGRGLFDPQGAVEFTIKHAEDTLRVEPTAFGAPGLTWKSSQDSQGRQIIEFALPNAGEGKWFWHGGGREIGSALQITDPAGRIYSMYQPYHLFYCRMLPAHGESGD